MRILLAFCLTTLAGIEPALASRAQTLTLRKPGKSAALLTVRALGRSVVVAAPGPGGRPLFEKPVRPGAEETFNVPGLRLGFKNPGGIDPRWLRLRIKPEARRLWRNIASVEFEIMEHGPNVAEGYVLENDRVTPAGVAELVKHSLVLDNSHLLAVEVSRVGWEHVTLGDHNALIEPVNAGAFHVLMVTGRSIVSRPYLVETTDGEPYEVVWMSENVN